MKKYIFQISVCALLLTLCGCKGASGKIRSGKIVYTVDYPDNKKNQFLYGILPKEMLLEFKDGQQKSSIRNANLQNLTWVDCNQKYLSFYFQYAEDAYKVNLTKSGVKKMLQEMEHYRIEKVDEQKKIAGFNCHKALVTSGDSGCQFDVWYTDEIDLKDPNWFTPFAELDGVLMEYEMKQFGLRMQFKAQEFQKCKPDELQQLMNVPAKGHEISFREYNKQMTGLFTTFE